MTIAPILLSSQTVVSSWLKHWGGDGSDVSPAMTIDVEGNILSAVRFSGSIYGNPDSDIILYIRNDSLVGFDFLIAKLNENGQFQWSKHIGGSGSVYPKDIQSDNQGNIFITGFFEKKIDFNPGIDSFFLITNGNYPDAFILKLDKNGNFIWAETFGGVEYDLAESIELDSTGIIYIGGSFGGTADFDPGPGIENLVANSAANGFICKYNPDGNFIWAKSFYGYHSEVLSISLDYENNIYSTGFFEISDFDPGPEVYQLGSFGPADCFISKLDQSGNFIWAKEIGGSDTDVGQKIGLDHESNVYVTGYFGDTVDFDPGPGNTSLQADVKDAFVLKLNKEGDFVWVDSFGREGLERGNDIALDSEGNVFVTGDFSTITDFDPGVGNYSLTAIGAIGKSDLFVVKLNSTGDLKWANNIGGNENDYSGLILPGASGDIYVAGIFQGKSYFNFGIMDSLVSLGNFDSFLLRLDQCNIDTTQLALVQEGNTIMVNYNGAIYQWLDCDNEYEKINDETNQNYTSAKTGNYAVIVEEGGCIDTSECVLVVITGTRENENNSDIAIYPNPSDDIFFVELKENYQDIKLSIRDATGRKVFSQKYSCMQNIEVVEPLPSGVYFVELVLNHIRKVVKLVVD